MSAPSDVAALLPALGFESGAATLNRESIRDLGLGSIVSSALVARGSGSLRALIIETSLPLSARDAARKAAERLSRSSPHILWLLLAVHGESRSLTFAAWSHDRNNLRTAALLVELDHVVDSDAETLCSLAAVRESVDLVVHARWIEILGRDALTRRFYRILESQVEGMALGMTGVSRTDDRNDLALLHTSRLLFLSFLEAKGWMNSDRDFLRRSFHECMRRGGGFHNHVLLPLLFGTLNTRPSMRSPAARAFGRIPFLNGGLFSRAPVERANARALIGDEYFGEMFDRLLTRYRFTVREDTTSWSETAIDPEMLGRAFESLMSSRSRHASGAFYTPQSMVERVTRSALFEALSARCDVTPEQIESAIRGVAVGAEASRKLRLATSDIRVLDPACGSGAFLVHLLDQLTALLLNTGDGPTPFDVRRRVLCTSIFGVDVNPMAVWLCELRLWLSIVIDSDESDPSAVRPLPNLDHNVRVGDSLAGGGFDAPGGGQTRRNEYSTLRERYMRATGRRKQHLARALDEWERSRAIRNTERALDSLRSQRRDLLMSERSRDLFGDRAHLSRASNPRQQELRLKSRELRYGIRRLQRGGALPFSFASHFPEAQGAGGFDIVVGNPPWVRLERIPPESRVLMRREFQVFRLAAWTPLGGNGAAASTFAPQVDLAALFVERGVSLLNSGGTLAFILPAKLWRSLAGAGLRQLVLRHLALSEMEDWSDAPASFDAVVYPSLLVGRRRGHRNREATRLIAATSAGTQTLRWSMEHQRLPLDASAGAPWLLVPTEVRNAFDLLTVTGVAFGASGLGPPRLGVKCGRNDAFVVNVQSRGTEEAGVRSRLRHGRVEASLLRPILRGESLRPWTAVPGAESIIWTHGNDMQPLRELPPLARRWFSQWRLDLVRRTDLGDTARWWSVFRTEAARSDRWRVVWPDIGRAPRAAVIPAGDPVVPLNSCYVSLLREPDDAFALATLLNSVLAAAWLNLLAEQARGGYRRYMAWTISVMPLPRDWKSARAALAPIGRAATASKAPADSDVLDAVLRCYGLRYEQVAPLLAWNGR
jgi:methylase of polypeptide subunit release factors